MKDLSTYVKISYFKVNKDVIFKEKDFLETTTGK